MSDKHPFELIEDGVLDVLAPLTDEGVRSLEQYAGQLTPDVGEIRIQYPFVLVAVWSMDAEIRNELRIEQYDVFLYVGSRHQQSIKKATRGSQAQPMGIWDLLRRIRQLMDYQTVIKGKGFTPAQLVAENGVVVDPDQSLVIYEAQYRLWYKVARSGSR